MRVVIVGPGALGCLLAAKLSLRTGHEVWLLDHSGERAQFLEKQGLLLHEGELTYQVPIRATSQAGDVGFADLVFLCVKSAHVEGALQSLAPLISEHLLLIALQNGISHHRVINERYRGQWAVGLTSQGSSLLQVGEVRHGGAGKTVIGFIKRDNFDEALLQKAGELLTESHIVTEIAKDVMSHVWNKFVINIGINALTVIYDCPNGRLIESPTVRARMVRLVKEAAAVAKAKGIEIDDNPVAMVEKVCRDTSSNISSMLQDVRKRKSTEIDAINGALLDEAFSLGVLVPANQEMVREIKAIEKSYLS